MAVDGSITIVFAILGGVAALLGLADLLPVPAVHGAPSATASAGR